ncbi:MAG: hypothetical protein QM756_06210 [Polyangiaceae bacterium]
MSNLSRSARVENPHRAACWLVFVVLVVFAFSIGGSMGAYPGGTHFNARSAGYDFAKFRCDALEETPPSTAAPTRAAPGSRRSRCGC